ncbi:MAG: (5-formylfuran-3-yl)methyl phosphate synthase [Gemmataceae bacterium]
MTQLLVSVRAVAEAQAALAGGAHLIDIKEPANGALGKADDATIQAILRDVAGRTPVSAALGEWHEGHLPPDADLAFVKWGCANAARRIDAWRLFLDSRIALRRPRCVHVAYADWQCAQAPPLDEVVAHAVRAPGAILLIDTHCKEAKGAARRPTLLDWLSEEDVYSLCRRCRAAGVRIALAGSLGLPEIERLRPARPDWFAVRGAACDGGRDGCVTAARVRMLVARIRGGVPDAAPAGAAAVFD